MLCYIFLFLSNCSLISCSRNFSVINRMKFVFLFYPNWLHTYLLVYNSHVSISAKKCFWCRIQYQTQKNWLVKHVFKIFSRYFNIFKIFYVYEILFWKINMVHCALHAIMWCSDLANNSFNSSFAKPSQIIVRYQV